jgi:hypothetical protein
MAAPDQAARLFEDADFLAAPATGGFGVKDFHAKASFGTFGASVCRILT